MTLRINTNLAALDAHKNMLKTDKGLSASLEKLSSGLRINRAADDSSGMAIADSLRSQGLSLGQAIRNANDGISMVQTADGALEESINIVNIIKTKAVQAAQDGQTTDSRKAIQADINKLMQELDIIAKTTSFNNQKLLSGNFTNKKFQIGAYSGETVDISIGTGESTKIGHISTSELTVAGPGTAALAVYSNIQDATYDINTVDVLYDNSKENSMGALADAINKISDILGITANASVKTSTDSAIKSGRTGSDFEINGIHIGQLDVVANDSNGSLVASINSKTDQHGVFAAVDEEGKLTLTSLDDRAIEITQNIDTTKVLGGTTGMSTLGKIVLTQDGTSEIVARDRAGGQAVALADNNLLTTGLISTTVESSLASGSVIMSGSTIAGGSTLAVGTSATISGAVSTTGSSTLGSGSVLKTGSELNSGTTIQGVFKTSAVAAGTGTLGKDSVVAAGSTIGAGTVTAFADVEKISGTITGTSLVSRLEIGSILTAGSKMSIGSTILLSDLVSGDFEGAGAGQWSIGDDNKTVMATAEQTVDVGNTVTAADGVITLAASSELFTLSSLGKGSSVGGDAILSGEFTTTSDMTLTTNTSLAIGSNLYAGTNLTGTVLKTTSEFTLTDDMTVTAASTIATESTLATGTKLSNAWYNNGNINVAGGDMTLGAGSSLVSGAIFAEGSSLGGTVTIAEDEIVDTATDMLIAKGSTLADGTVITTGTTVTSDLVATDGTTYVAGTQLTSDITISEATVLTADISLNSNSILAAGSTLTVNDQAVDGSAVSSISTAVSYRLSDVDVTSQDSAQIAIAVASAALKALDKVRADLGSVQNQLTSTIANITVTRVNIFAAESAIRDVDFAEEAANFTKMQILAQAGAFAMAQANASSQNVLSLLQ